MHLERDKEKKEEEVRMKGHKKGRRVRMFVGHTEIPLWGMGGSQRMKKGKEEDKREEGREE